MLRRGIDGAGIGEGGGDEEDVRLVVRTIPSRVNKSESSSDGTFDVPAVWANRPMLDQRSTQASSLDVEAAAAAGFTDLSHHFLDQPLLPTELRHLGLKTPSDHRRQTDAAKQVRRDPLLRAGSA